MKDKVIILDIGNRMEVFSFFFFLRFRLCVCFCVCVYTTWMQVPLKARRGTWTPGARVTVVVLSDMSAGN